MYCCSACSYSIYNKEINLKIGETKEKWASFGSGGFGFRLGFGTRNPTRTDPNFFAKPEPEPNAKLATRNSTMAYNKPEVECFSGME